MRAQSQARLQERHSELDTLYEPSVDSPTALSNRDLAIRFEEVLAAAGRNADICFIVDSGLRRSIISQALRRSLVSASF